MTILFDASQTVQPTSFGRGLFAYSPSRRFNGRTASDAAWLLADEIRRQEEADVREDAMRAAFNAENADLDRQAGEAAYLDEFHHYGCNRS